LAIKPKYGPVPTKALDSFATYLTFREGASYRLLKEGIDDATADLKRDLLDGAWFQKVREMASISHDERSVTSRPLIRGLDRWKAKVGRAALDAYRQASDFSRGATGAPVSDTFTTARSATSACNEVIAVLADCSLFQTIDPILTKETNGCLPGDFPGDLQEYCDAIDAAIAREVRSEHESKLLVMELNSLPTDAMLDRVEAILNSQEQRSISAPIARQQQPSTKDLTADIGLSRKEAKARRDKAILLIWSRRRTGNIDYEFVCTKLDEQNVTVPDSRVTGSTWLSNLSNHRESTKRYIQSVIRPTAK
jgi:hypothetical protein